MNSKIPQLIAVVLCSVFGLIQTSRADEAVHNVRELVITGHPVSTEVGLDILHNGGNAADALIAVSLSLGVTERVTLGSGGSWCCFTTMPRPKPFHA